MIQNVLHKLKLTLLLLIGCAILGAVSLWVILTHGVELEHIQLSSLAIEHFTIRLDGGLRVGADRVILSDSPSRGPAPDPGLYISGFNRWAHLFGEIELRRIDFQARTYQLLFKNNRFTLSGEDFQLVSTLEHDNGTVRSDISRLEIKPYQVTLSGRGTYTRRSSQLKFTGSFNTPETSGSLTVTRSQHLVVTEIATERFTNLQGLLARLPLDQELSAWIQESITARDYQVTNFRVAVPLHGGRPDLDALSLSGIAIARDGAVRFEPSLPPVLCRTIHLSLADDRLTFGLDKPVYKDIPLDGSNVTIDHLTADVSEMDIFIKTDTTLNKDILELLQAYEISLPFRQQTGTTHGELHLVFDIPDFTLRTRGSFTAGKGDWQWGDISFASDKTTVTLQDEKVDILEGSISYGDVAQGTVTGEIDISKGVAELEAGIDRFSFRDGKQEVVEIHDLVTPVQVSFSDTGTDISLPQLKTTLVIDPSRVLLSLEDINAVREYIPHLAALPMQQGRADIDFSNQPDLSFSGEFVTSKIPLELDDREITHYTFSGTKTNDQLSLSLNDDRVRVTVSDRIDVTLKDYMVTIDTGRLGTQPGPLSAMPLSINGTSSLIRTDILSIPTRDFQVEVTGPVISYTAGLEQGQVLYSSNGDDMTLAASDIDGELAQDFFKYADLKGGRFSFSLQGKDMKDFSGVATFSNVLIKDMALVNNILAFLNTIPALATLSSPGFDADGYHVKEGVAKFTLRNKLLTLEQVRTDGTAINTEMSGWVDFANDTVQLNLELISLKDFSKIINLIPLAGYAILGENGSLSTSLLVSGNRKQPDITTNLSAEIIMMPVNIIKRTIVWPFRTIDKIIEPFRDSPEPDNSPVPTEE